VTVRGGSTFGIGGSENSHEPEKDSQKSQDINHMALIHENKLSDASLFVKAYFTPTFMNNSSEELTGEGIECKLNSFNHG
jgi:hypothetical protein